MSETAAPATPAAAAPAPEAAPAEATPETTQAAPVEAANDAPPAPVEGEPTPKEPPPPPRVAEARKMLDKANKAQAAADAKLKEVETREQALAADSERLKGLIQRSRVEYELGRDIKALQGPGSTKKLLSLLKASGVQLDTRELASALLEGDDDDRPLTRRELREIEDEKQKAANEAAKAEAKKSDEQKAQTKAKAEGDFLAMAPGKAPTVAKMLARLGSHGRLLVLERAYKAQAELQAARQPSDLEAIVAKVEEMVRAEYPEWAPTTEPAAPAGAAPTSGKRPTAIGNAATTRGTQPKPLSQMSEDERWAEYARKQKQGAQLWEARTTPPSKASSTRFTRAMSSPTRSSPSCPRWPWRRRCPSPAPSTASG